MFVIGHLDRLVDQQHRDVVVNPVRTAQARVVQHIADVQQWTPIGWADQDAQKFFVKHRDGV